ncbi:MAG TPA: hypothetical protein VGR07_08335, partial [Thermoanaerobaculia bacterium]|nr:hypothetical protein [Thermoanaerobaculia bacterium]
EGYRLAGRSYRPILPDEQGRLWSEQWGVSLGTWEGVVEGRKAEWVRLFRPDGSLVPTRAEAAQQRADAEQQRADAAETEVARLQALLAERGRG